MNNHEMTSIRKSRDIDFHSVALYLPAVQVVMALLLCCATVLTLASTSADCRSAAPRAATLSAIVSLVCVFKPIRVQEVHGMDLIFDTIRPAVVTYWIALICEQLVYTGCASTVAQVAGEAASITHTTTAHRIVYHLLILAATTAGFLRAYNPMSQQDVPFLVSSVALIFIALFPPTPLDTIGPLCHIDGIWDAAERLARALLFGLVFCALSYASEPTRHSVGEIALCASRATAASAWILGVHPFALPLALIQAIVAILRRIQSEPIYDTASETSERYSTFQIQGFQGGLSDEEGGMTSYEMSDEGELPSVEDEYEEAYAAQAVHLAQRPSYRHHSTMPTPQKTLTSANNGIRFEGMIDDSLSHTDSNPSSNHSSIDSIGVAVQPPHPPIGQHTQHTTHNTQPSLAGPGGAFTQIPSKQRMEEIAAFVQ